jgi:hypothetical protein
MGLRDFFRRHGNVFSVSTQRVDSESGNVDMLEEEYGERAVEERRSSGARIGFRGGALQAVGEPPLVDVSEDGILEGDDPPPDPAP